MPEEPKDMEKLKLDLLNLEKRFVDTELSVAEIKEKIKDMSISELKERMEELAGIKEKMEEIEDLVMVEQAGLLELKKMMEEKKAPEAEVSIPPEFEERMEKIEERLRAAPKIEVGEIRTKIDSISKEMKEIRAEIDKSITEMKERIGGVQFLASRIETLKSTLDGLVGKRAETDVRLQDMERELTKIQSRITEKTPEGIIERLSLLGKETEEKLERFRAMEEKARGIEMRLEKMKEMEGTEFAKEVSEIKDDLKDLSIRLDETEKGTQKIEELGSGVDALRNITDKLAERTASLEKAYAGMKEMPDLSKEIEEMKKTQIPQIGELSRKISETIMRIQDTTNRLNDLNKRMDSLESAQKSLEGIAKEIEKTRPLIERRIEEVNKGLSTIITSETKPLAERMSSLEKSLAQVVKEKKPEELRKMLKEFDTRIAQIEKILASTEQRYRREVEEIKSFVREVIGRIEAPSTFETQIKELIEKTVFLESRLGAIEKILRETARTHPIILE